MTATTPYLTIMSVLVNSLQSCQRHLVLDNQLGSYGADEWIEPSSSSAVLTPTILFGHIYYLHLDLKVLVGGLSSLYVKLAGNRILYQAIAPSIGQVYTCSTMIDYIDETSSEVPVLTIGVEGSSSTSSLLAMRDGRLYDATELWGYIQKEIEKGRADSESDWCASALEYSSSSLELTLYDPTDLESPVVEDTGAASLIISGETPVFDKAHATIEGGSLFGVDVVDVDSLASRHICGNCGNWGTKHFIYDDPYFDAGTNNVLLYNNTNGNVTYALEDAQSDSPFLSRHRRNLRVVTVGTASPQFGGVEFLWKSYADAIFMQVIVAKIPVGYCIGYGTNAQGDGTTAWSSDNTGTGEFKEYRFCRKCGSTGSFSTGGYIYIFKANWTITDSDYPLTWYIAAAFTLDITGHPEYQSIHVLPSSNGYEGNTLFYTGDLSVEGMGNLIVNGGGDLGSSRNLTNIAIDYDEYPATDEYGTKCSFVKGEGTGESLFTDYIPIDHASLYSLSFWVRKSSATTNSLQPVLHYYDSTKTEITSAVYLPLTIAAQSTQDWVLVSRLISASEVETQYKGQGYTIDDTFTRQARYVRFSLGKNALESGEYYSDVRFSRITNPALHCDSVLHLV